MTDTDRINLARQVLNTAFEKSESWRENNLGSDLAYLTWAIIDNDEPNSFVDWAEDCEPTLALFRQWFPPDHDVWRFIEL